MNRSIAELVGFGAVCSVAILVATVGQTIAATKQATESGSVAAAKQPSKQEQYPSVQRIKKSLVPTAMERQPKTVRKQAKPEQIKLKPITPRNLRHIKVYRKEVPKTLVHSRTDLMYHGILESPQRYDPRRSRHGGGVPYPHISEWTHDHFQELDRNQDGRIDPVERTFGRPDMDRDLHDRRPR